jgi:hypothetical protein
MAGEQVVDLTGCPHPGSWSRCPNGQVSQMDNGMAEDPGAGSASNNRKFDRVIWINTHRR